MMIWPGASRDRPIARKAIVAAMSVGSPMLRSGYQGENQNTILAIDLPSVLINPCET